jgi:hypothetical protein
LADRIVITKTDIADGTTMRELSQRLAQLKPSAHQLESAPSIAIDADLLLTRDLYDLEGEAEEVRRCLAVEKQVAVAPAATPIIWTPISTMPASMLFVCDSSGRWIGLPSASG